MRSSNSQRDGISGSGERQSQTRRVHNEGLRSTENATRRHKLGLIVFRERKDDEASIPDATEEASLDVAALGESVRCMKHNLGVVSYVLRLLAVESQVELRVACP